MIKDIIAYVKLASVIALSIIILFIKDLSFMSLIIIIQIVFLLTQKTKYKLLERTKPLLYVSLAVIIFQIFFNNSVDLYRRVYLGVATSQKIILLSLTVIIFTAITSISEIISSLSFLPRKVILMLTITFSLIPIIIEESQKIRLIQQARGHSFAFFNIYRSLFPIIIPLVHRTLKRAETLSMVLLTRGYEA